MKIVITGATSMIGLALINESIKRGHEIFAIIRKDSKRKHKIPCNENVTIIESEIDNIDKISINEKCDALYHLAWVGTSRKDRDNRLIQEKNILFSKKAVNLAKALGCKKFIGAGSQAEYGIVTDIINETTPVDPKTAYGEFKHKANIATRELCHLYGIEHFWARIFSVYGINDVDGTLIDYALKKFKNNEDAFFSSSKQYWNFLYEADAAKLLLGLVECHVSSGVYCIADPISRPLKSYIEEIRIITKTDSICHYQASQKNGTINLNVDASKTYKAISFSPETSFINSIKVIYDEKYNTK